MASNPEDTARLAEIRQRLDSYAGWPYSGQDDVRFLLDKCAALSTEVERLTAENARLADEGLLEARERDLEAFAAERDTLKAVVRDVVQQMRADLALVNRGGNRIEQWADTLAAALRPTGAGEEP